MVRYPLDKGNNTQLYFAVFGGGDQDTEKAPDEPLFMPILEAGGITVSDWKDSFKPRII